MINDSVLLEVELDGVVDSDDWVGVSNGSSVVGNDVRNSLGAELDLSDLAELVGSLLLRDSVDGESSLDVVEDSEVLSRLLDGDGVHESEGEGVVGSDLIVVRRKRKRERRVRMGGGKEGKGRGGRRGGRRTNLSVNLDESLLEDSSDLSSGEGELQSVSKEDGEGETLSELVRSGGRSRSLD